MAYAPSHADAAERASTVYVKKKPATRLRASLAAFGAVVIACSIASPLSPASAAPVAAAAAEARPATPQLILNGNFAKGKTGWKVKSPKKHKFVVNKTGRAKSLGARITTKNKKTVVLTDRSSTVGATLAGTKYAVSVWVRSSKPGATARVRVTEKSTSGKKSITQRSVKLKSTSWRKLSFNVTAKKNGSTLDLEIRYSKVKVGQNLYADDASFRIAPSKSKPGSDVSNPPTSDPNPSGVCTRPAPSKGTQFGSSISMTSTIWAEHALADRDERFGKIAAVRIWDEPMPFSWSDRRTSHLAGRTLVMSFRPKPADVLKGKHDAELRKWFKEAPANSTIYWSYVHEPETPIDDQKLYSADEYRRAWQHIDKIADSVCRQNMYATLILMGWTANPSSKKDWRKYYAGNDVIDVLAFDPYNGVHDLDRDYYATPSSMMSGPIAVAKAAGKPWAIAEIGSRKIPSDASGKKRAAWLTDVADYTRTNGALFVTYFQSTRDGEWRLLDQPSMDAWRAAVSSSPKK